MYVHMYMYMYMYMHIYMYTCINNMYRADDAEERTRQC